MVLPTAVDVLSSFPTDPQTYGIDEQFLWGSSILVSPALHEVRYLLIFLSFQTMTDISAAAAVYVLLN